MERFTSVDDYIESADAWRDELVELRRILQATELEETVKWGGPCYTINGKNVVALGAFKSYFGLWFYQGALLADKHRVLVNAQEGRTKALRQLRFHSKQEMNKKLIKEYVREAIELQKGGKEIKPDRNKPLDVPPELKRALAKNKPAQASFKQLALGKQREYAEYISGAKRAETKLSRLDKILPMIVEGKGLNDKYR